MDIANITKAITARIAADTTLTGSINGYGFDVIPKTIDPPYLVFNVDLSPEDDGFNCDATWVTMRVFVVTDKRLGLTAASDLLKRIYGDGIQQSNRLPTYGFHRHTFTFSDTNYKDAGCVRTSATTAHTDEHYVFVEEYRFRVERSS